MNETSQNPHRTLMLTFSFDIDIEKVYLGIFSKQCLEKIGLYRTDISTTEDEIERYLTINSLPIYLHKLNFISTPTSKTIEEKVVSLNNKKVTTNFTIRYHLYVNSEDNSTVFIFELLSNEENDPFMNEYLH